MVLHNCCENRKRFFERWGTIKFNDVYSFFLRGRPGVTELE